MNGCKHCPAYAKCTATYRGSACAALRNSYGVDTDPEIEAKAEEETKLAFLLATSPHLDLVDGRGYKQAASDLIANGVTLGKDANVPDMWEIKLRLAEAQKECACFANYVGRTVCTLTKDIIICHCGGDRKHCDFYPDYRGDRP